MVIDKCSGESITNYYKNNQKVENHNRYPKQPFKMSIQISRKTKLNVGIEFAYLNAYAKVKKWIFDVQFPGNCFEFGII